VQVIQSRNKPVSRRADVLDGRAGYRITADWGHISVLEGGGHICELISNRHDGVNPLWKPPWKTIDPTDYKAGKHKRTYGPMPDGRLLAGIAGHNLSFDHFGPPSAEETAAGHSTHGEAPALKWKVHKIINAPPTLKYGVTLPESQIRFIRTLSVDPLDPVVYCEESAVSLSTLDRPISWNEHVTFGPPFVESGVTTFDMAATMAKVCPASYSSSMSIRPEAEFRWPLAPLKGKGHANLRTTPDRDFSHYTAQLVDPRLEIGFVAACNARLGLLVVYAFRRRDFPWVGNWEERFYLQGAPWRGRTFCRGLEFSSTPFAIPRRETVTQGPLFGETTYRWLPAKAEAKVRFMILLLNVPTSFQGVAGFALHGKKAVVTEIKSGRKFALPVKKFL
jgi:hypothetical protein